MAGTLGGEGWQRSNALPPKLTHGVIGASLGLKLKRRRRSMHTGTLILCWDNRSHVWPNMNGCGWVTECVEHKDAAGHRTSAIAMKAMTHPYLWCDRCEPLERGIKPGQVRDDHMVKEVLAKLESLYGGHKEKTQ